MKNETKQKTGSFSTSLVAFNREREQIADKKPGDVYRDCDSCPCFINGSCKKITQ